MDEKQVGGYRILEKIHAGRIGKVYLAEDTRLNRKVALKFLSLSLTPHDSVPEILSREIKTASTLNHPNIVTIHEINQSKNQIYIAMEYVKGQTIKEKAKKLSTGDIIDMIKQVCQGLEHAHQAGIIHKAIKPQHIIVDENNRIKILDFGLSGITAANQKTGGIFSIDNLPYMSPEQVKGKTPDHRTDIWSLGTVLYEMLTHQIPFKGEKEQEIFNSILNETPVPPGQIHKGLSAGLERIILKCLHKNKKERYSSARQIIKDLDRVKENFQEEKQEQPIYSKKASKDRKETECRHATVLCAEISGPGRAREEIDAEEAAVTVNDCLERLSVIIDRYGSGINKIAGNGITAFFGVPTAVEEAPKRAASAALEMLDHIRDFNRGKKSAVPLDIRIGIESGLVIAGTIVGKEKRDYAVTGDPVTLALQLKDLSVNGQICAGPIIHQYTEKEFQYKPLKSIALKGRETPVETYELLFFKAAAQDRKVPPERSISSQMVGRDKELDKLKFHVSKLINGEGSIVSVVGEAGIGKSRLISELIKLDDAGEAKILEGQALSYGKHMSYHPVIDIIKNWANIKKEDNEKDSSGKLEQAIIEICPGEWQEIFPFTATLMGMKLKGEHALRIKGIEGNSLARLIQKSLRELLIKEAQRNPLLCIFHDLHWADQSSIKLLESLFRAAEKYPVLFILVMRPNYPDTTEKILENLAGAYERIHTVMYLEPLSEKLCQLLIHNFLKSGELPANTRNTIISRAEGNPFFIEEVLYSFIDEGVITIRDGTFKITGRVESAVVPETLQEVLMARIDRLDETTILLLKMASVIGRYFFYKILTRIAGEIRGIHQRLLYLKDLQLIGEQRRLDEAEYHFKHVLVQEVVYESILVKTRKKLHLRVAAAIESIFSQRIHEFYSMLAFHYSRGENLEKAEEYLIKAGQGALKSAASNEALTYFSEALNLYLKKYTNKANPEKIAMLKKNIAEALYYKGLFAEAVEYFDQVLDSLGVKRPKNKFIIYLKLMLNLFWVLKNLYFPSKKIKKVPGKRDNEILNLVGKQSIASLDFDTHRFFADSIAQLRKLMTFNIAKVENGPSFFSSASGLFSYTGFSFKVSRKILDQAKKFIDKSDIKSTIDYSYLDLILNLYSGSWKSEILYDYELIRQNLNKGEFFYTAAFPAQLAVLKIEQGQFAQIGPLLKILSYISETYGTDLTQEWEHVLDTRRLIEQRKLHHALERVDQAILLSTKRHHNVTGLHAYALKVFIQVLLGDMKAAGQTLSHLKEMIPNEKEIPPPQTGIIRLSRFLFHIYKLEESSGDNDNAKFSHWRKKAYHSGKAAVKSTVKYAPIKTKVYKLMGIYYWLIQRQGNALTWWNKTIQVGENLGARPELARTYMEVGKRLMEEKSKYRELNGIPASQYLEKARHLFEEMGLEYDLKSLEAVEMRIKERQGETGNA